MKKLLMMATMVAVASASMANSRTIATFLDPADSGATSLFVFNTTTNILTGSFTGTGLTVRTPGLNGGGEVTNAKFQTSPIQLVPVAGTNLYAGGTGTVRFYTSDINNPFLLVNFTGATLFDPLNFGASEFNGSIVNFSGPNVPGGLSNEQFSFALANRHVVGDEIRYTASFTSSAVPEPATMTALALGAAAILRRRKKSSN